MNGPKRKPVIGLIGGIGSGKSTVAQFMGDLGAVVLDADALGHQMLAREQVKQAARRRWGDAIFDRHGTIDRTALARIVFGPDEKANAERKYLEELVHPLIGQELRRRLGEAQARSEVPAVVIDAALLIEAGWDEVCDYVIYVDSGRQQQHERVAAARGWSAEQVAARQRVQESLTVKRARADEVVDNSGARDATLRQVERIFSRLTKHPPAKSER